MISSCCGGEASSRRQPVGFDDLTVRALTPKAAPASRRADDGPTTRAPAGSNIEARRINPGTFMMAALIPIPMRSLPKSLATRQS